MQIQNSGQNTSAAGHLPPQAKAIQPGLLPPPSAMRPQPRPQAPAPSQQPEVPDTPISARIGAKRRQEAAAHEPGDPTSNKKAKSTGQTDRSQPTVKLEVEDPAAPRYAEPVPEIPQTLVDPLDALLTFGLQAQRPAARVGADDLPMLEPSPPVARIETKSASQPPAQATAGADLLRQARDPQPLVGLTPDAGRTARAVRTQMFEDWARGLTPDQRLDAFHQAGRELALAGPHTPSQCIQSNLLSLELDALAKHLPPQQHHEALEAAKNPEPYLGIAGGAPPRVLRRLQLSALYRSMSPADREPELAAARNASGLLHLNNNDFEARARLRFDQFSALAQLHAAHGVLDDLAEMRLAGVTRTTNSALALRAAFLARTQLRAMLVNLCSHHRATARTGALAMTPALQELSDDLWRRTLVRRRDEFIIHANLMTAAERLEALDEALRPGDLGALNTPGRKRAVELHTALVSAVLKEMNPEELDAALARLKDRQALAGLGGSSREVALLLHTAALDAWIAAWKRALPGAGNQSAPSQ